MISYCFSSKKNRRNNFSTCTYFTFHLLLLFVGVLYFFYSSSFINLFAPFLLCKRHFFQLQWSFEFEALQWRYVFILFHSRFFFICISSSSCFFVVIALKAFFRLVFQMTSISRYMEKKSAPHMATPSIMDSIMFALTMVL